jgi:hypothetical protein
VTWCGEGVAGQRDTHVFVRAMFHNACSHKALLKEDEEGWVARHFHRAIEMPVHSSWGGRGG